MNDISSSIKKVLIVFLIFFMILITYITYFTIFVGPTVVLKTENKRLWVKRNEVLRGTIYDINMKPLTKSERVDKLTQKREYTGGEMFAHLLGYVDIKYGITGLEKKYDPQLMGTDSDESLMSMLNLKGDKKEEKIGDSLKISVDYNVQKVAFDALGDKRGAVVAINPKTGEIIAMVSKPSYDPNKLSEIWGKINTDKDRPLINRATSGLYPPGSTFKTITAISCLENIPGIKSENFNDTGKIVFNSRESLSDFGGEVPGNLSFKKAYVISSNVVFGTLAMRLGNNKLKTTAEKFYFNRNIPADGFGIENSKFPTLKSNEKGNIAQSGIGQASVLASPMEMALLTSTIANDGVMMKPYLVSQVVSSKGSVKKDTKPQALAQVITPEIAKTMKEYMRGVVSEGTGGRAAVAGIDVSGKTGTADHYDEGKNAPPHSWFIGFAPYDNSKIAVAVIVEDGGQGGIAAAAIAAKVIKTYLGK